MSSNISNIIHILSIVLPFSNETAIVLTESGYSQFKDFYKVCFDKSLLGKNSSKLQNKLKDKICTLPGTYPLVGSILSKDA